MLGASDVMPTLLATTPSFAPAWAAYLAEPDTDADLLYLHLAEYARHLLTLAEAGHATALRAAFAAVERLHAEGDGYVREAATVGLLEALQNHAEHAGVAPGRLAPYLGPESRRGWEALNRFWFGQPEHPGLAG